MTQRTTPNWLADDLIEASSLTDHMNVLEPSAGAGNIANRIVDNFTFKGVYITAVELNKQLHSSLQEKADNFSLGNTTTGIQRAINADFLKHDFEGEVFNRIIAAPPFKNNVDVLHIQRMFQLLATHGILVSLTTPYWLTNNETHQVEFRQWLQGKKYAFKMLPDNTFMEKGKTVPTARIIIYK